MFMRVKDFLAPTRGRIVLFIIIFVMVMLYDTIFAPFPGSPVAENIGTQEGAMSFVLYILVLPYILSCLLPAFLGLRKRRFKRLVTLSRFLYSRPVEHENKPTKQEHFVFPQNTPVVESVLSQAEQASVQGPAQSPQPAAKAKASAKPKRKARKKAGKK
jgi:hypothetical protein